MSSHRVQDITFSSDEQACQTMEMDLNPAPAKKSPPANSDDATVVLDLTATQIHDLLDTETAAQNESRARNVKR